MADKKYYPDSYVPIRKTEELLPTTFRTPANKKFMAGVVDPLVQPGVLDKKVGYVGRRFGKTYNGSDPYLDTDDTLRSVYQLEPGVVFKDNDKITDFYDYLDFKSILQFFNNASDRDDKITAQDHYTWNPPISWDKFVNFREYYWAPAGPPSIEIAGEFDTIDSTYSVQLGTLKNTFVFTPDGYTNNPTITLYRGQTYKFDVNCPDEGFTIRTNYDTGSLQYDCNFPYSKGQLVVFDGKIWEAQNDVLAVGANEAGEGCHEYFVITEEDPDWKEVALVSSRNALDYNKGVTNNGAEFGTVEFTVPYDAPDVLFYQGIIDPNSVGRFMIEDVISNTKIDVESEIIGKQTYTSSNNVILSNGLIVNFTGKVTPEKYADSDWLVQGVGSVITLTRFDTLIPPAIISEIAADVLFDNEPFDSQPFADAKYVPLEKDYITIARDGQDANAWSRYNRWFHKSVLNYAYSLRGQNYPAPEENRAKRPIIEFNSNIQLFNHGAKAKPIVDYIDDYTDDVFSIIEGTRNYNVDGEFLFDGARLLVTADTDKLANNRIYVVKKITHLGNEQITLVEAEDSEPLLGECVMVRRGTKNEGKMFHFNGTNWVPSQEKLTVNQPPLFDVFDENGVSFGDEETYPVTSFEGTPLVAYSIGDSVADSELGFSLDYLSIDNIGDILFKWLWDSETFTYIENKTPQTKNIATGFYKKNPDEEYLNGWTLFDKTYAQPIVDSLIMNDEADTNIVNFKTIDWNAFAPDYSFIVFYKNGTKINIPYVFSDGSFVFSSNFTQNDVVTIKIISDISPRFGYYEIPLGLEKNPLNKELTEFTYGQAVDHLRSALEFDTRLLGALPGNTNLRDIDRYQSAAKQFLKHSGSAPLALSLLADKDTNIIKSIKYAKKSYSDFKNNFLERSTKIAYNDNMVDFVDDVIEALTKTKTANSPWSDSDMIGSGAYTSLDYTVSDEGITTFALSTTFSLDEISRTAVYVYLNGTQLLHKRDYDFNATFGFVNIIKPLAENDEIQIREYVSTAVNHIPPTPTSLGMYKKYTPMIFVDDTYTDPQTVIQGHDGSITVAYGDYRDNLLLELEYRIYNNIKQEYNTELFDIDEVVGGYYRTSLFTKDELDEIVSPEYLKWIHLTKYDHTSNQYFRETEPFTYTYSNMTDPTKTQHLPGYWRGVYQWAYDTDRPHRCPWEMLGFSQQPDWWDEQYGEFPYTSNNLLLWEDIENGVIRQGSRAGIDNRYKRPGLSKYLPVDGNGNLLNPLDAGFATNFTLINNKGDFKPGDIAPAEYAWRSSSEWPFVIVMAMCLLKPFEFITSNFDRSKSKVNKIGQTVNTITNMFVTPDDIIVPALDGEQSEGLVQYVTGYIKAKGSTEAVLRDRLASIDVNLSTRMSGFVDKAEQKYLLDSKNPGSTDESVFIPPENYDIIFNVSSPITTVTYSGVVVEKLDNGWSLSGYDTTAPYFNYYEAVPVKKDPSFIVGGVSAAYVDWSENKVFANGQYCKYNETFYRCLKSHRSSDDGFTKEYWQKLAKLPVVGGISAIRRSKFNKFTVKRFLYGTVLSTIQDVVDILLGYSEYLVAQGFIFDNYDYENNTAQDWITSCKEFMFWTSHNWAVGSLITLSPGALKLKINKDIGVADNILDGFYEYQIFQSDGTPLPVKNIDVLREFQTTTVEAVDTNDGIYFLKLFYVLKEHVTVFDDRTVFNDIIYDETTGYRQGRLKSRTFRTTDWDGDYTSPGFIFDNVSIATWEPFKDYKLGDIVAYKSYYWTSQVNQYGQETFDHSKWQRTDSELKKQLVANFDYKVKQIEDYYNVTAEGLGSQPRTLARHAVGYQQRQYLQDLAEDPTTQFLIYQGFVAEKGTNNAIVKVFDKLSKNVTSTIELNEEWAFKVGQIGGTEQLSEYEFTMSTDAFKLNPQPISLVEYLPPSEEYHQYHIVDLDDFTINSENLTESFIPVKYYNTLYRSAGYVNPDTIDYTIKHRDGLYDIDLNTLEDNQYIWVTFDITDAKHHWTVLRFAYIDLDFINADVSGEEITFHTFQPHIFKQGELFVIKGIEDVTGIYNINRVTPKTITIVIPGFTNSDLEFDRSNVFVGKFYESRIYDINDYPASSAAALPSRSKLWIDSNKDGLWEVIEKQQVYNSSLITYFGVADPTNAGKAVLYNKFANHLIVTIPYPGVTVTYLETDDGLVIKQALEGPTNFESTLSNHYGDVLAMSPDGKWLAVGCPTVSFAPHYYLGELTDIIASGEVTLLQANQQVLYNEVLYKTLRNWDISSEDVQADLDNYIATGFSLDICEDSTPCIYWEEVTINLATHQYVGNIQGEAGGAVSQGAIIIYEYHKNAWKLYDMIVSPVPVENERFGQSISMSFNRNDEYYMNVSAPGTNSVYTFTSRDGEWTLPSTDYAIDVVAEPGDMFGYSVSASALGDMLAVSSPSATVDSSEFSGKVDIFNKQSGEYVHIQTIDPPEYNSESRFGYCTKFNDAGTTLVITAPMFDSEEYNTGSAYVYNANATGEFVYSQELSSYSEYPDENFGIAIDMSRDTLVIGARNTPYVIDTPFDETSTTFDDGLTTFSVEIGYLGAAYVFELKSDEYFLTEKLDTTDFVKNEGFGNSVSCEDDIIAVGSHYYSSVNAYDETVITGNARLFRKQPLESSWNTVELQKPVADISKIKSIMLYDYDENIVLDELDYVDNAKLKILNQAEQELSFKLVYDPAIYSVGTESNVVDERQAWAESNVGKLWWDLSTVKWGWYEQADFAYNVANWNTSAPFSTIDVYEWVETPYLPSEWLELADTNEGLSANISGVPKYADDTVYSKKEIYNTVTGKLQKTMYYYWVKNTVVVPANVVGRRISANDVTQMIENPIGTGLPYVGLAGNNKILAFNFDQYTSTTTIAMNVQTIKNTREKLNPIHNEYLLLTEGVKESVPTAKLEEKWIDSLVGTNVIGARVPDTNLPDKLKYGLNFRPIQSMFIDRLPILQTSIEHINSILEIEPFADTINFEYLNLYDSEPVEELNLYDVAVDTLLDLNEVGTVRIKRAKFSVTVVDGEIDTIEIDDKGFGYRIAPTIIIDGDGSGATAEVTIDRIGQVDSVTITDKGKRYSNATVTARSFSVLVHTDETINNFWCIYAWDDERNDFFRRETQGYDTRRYWDYKDWWKEGYGIKSRIVKELQTIVSVPTIVVELGDLIRIKEFSSGGWAVFEKVSDTATRFSDAYEIVGRENGTIEFLSSLYDHTIGYDYIDPYDIANYDYSRAKELRNIFKAVKNDIFVGDYEVEWNNLFFKSVQYAFVEQPYIDWAFKTSFLTATHNIGNLSQPINYKLENLESFNDYINEIKPYRTTIREYIESHTTSDYALNTTTDFDLPAVYSEADGKIIPITERDAQINSFPWKWWLDNKGYSLDRIEVSTGGEDYLQPPTIVIEGDGEGAEARAYIANGKVSYIEVTNSGHNYIEPPVVTLVGGNLPGSPEATVSPILGSSKIRTLDIGMKFDRITKEGFVVDYSQTDKFIAPGNTATFNLRYVPAYDKSKVLITINGHIVFLSEYEISVYAIKTENNSSLYGRIIFKTVPAEDSEIIITYEKNDLYLDAVNMINKYYAPTSGMEGNVTTQLMTGIDFGGTMVQGTTFDVTGGWDALPWYTDTWDSVESSNDFHVRANSVIDTVTLPYVPTDGQIITIYYVSNPYAKLIIDFENAVLSNGGSIKVETVGEYITNCTINFVSAEDLVEQLVKNPCISVATFDDINTNVLTILGAFTGSDKVITVTDITVTDIVNVPVPIDNVVGYGKDEIQPTRIDDMSYGIIDSSTVINPDALMPTFIGDGSTTIIDIAPYLDVALGDTLIFRDEESDGTVIINDRNIVDTDLQGGDLTAIDSVPVVVAPNTMYGTYSTATGLTAEEIVILGQDFVSPEHVPAPEENVPGQVLDNLSIRVFNSTFGGVAPLQVKTRLGDDVTTVYDIGIDIIETTSVIVYVDKIQRELGQGIDDYSLNISEGTIEFVTPPAAGQIVEIIAIGLGGINILDYQDFIADGETSLFLTSADFDKTGSIFVTMDGEYIDAAYLNSSELIDTQDKTLVRFDFNPDAGADIKIITFGESDEDLSNLIRINKKTVIYDGITLEIELDNFINDTDVNAASAIIVELNGKALRGVDSNYVIYDGTNNVIEMQPGTLSTNISVYVDNKLLEYIADYQYNGLTRNLSIDVNNLTIGSTIQVVNNQHAEYNIVDNKVVVENLPSLTIGDEFEITWFSRYEAMGVVADEYAGGAVEYKLLKQPLGLGYVWVYLNGERLTVNFDYAVSIPTSRLRLSVPTIEDDIVKIIVFGTVAYKPTSAFEIHKDMVNAYSFSNYSITDVELASELFYYEDEMKVTDASSLPEPQQNKNIPGVVMIDGERIEYMIKDGNYLKQLRRGVAGTATKEEYAVGTPVIDLGRNSALPYNDKEDRVTFNSTGFINKFVGDGINTAFTLRFAYVDIDSLHVYVDDVIMEAYTVNGDILIFDNAPTVDANIEVRSLLIGPLPYVPIKSSRPWVREETSTIPESYGPCDVVEVFVAGQRLRKEPMWQYSEELGSTSPSSDVYIDAEFSTNGTGEYIRVTDDIISDVIVEIVRRTGETWYNQDTTLLDNTTLVAQAIAEKTTLIPE